MTIVNGALVPLDRYSLTLQAIKRCVANLWADESQGRREVNDDWFTDEQLHIAAQDGDIARAQQLLSAGYDPNVFDAIDFTPLHYAVKHEHFDMVSLLLKHGADVNAHNEPRIGDTPIARFAQTCSLKMAQLLLGAGANPKIRGWMQLNALDRVEGRKRGDGPKVRSLIHQYAVRFP